jgi:peptidoglycan/xylan/chitin deacetylase (PgdA/CDA1 family)
MKILKKSALFAAAIGVIIMTACTSAENTSSMENTSSTAESEAVTTAETTAAPVITEPTFKEPSEYGKVIALTFDDGPSDDATGMVLDLLEKYDITASFFLIGDNITEEREDIVRRAAEMGCEIDNHSKTHSYMTHFTVDEITAEMDYTSEKIEEITGIKPKFFRPPYISVNMDMFDNIDLPFIAGYGCDDWDTSVTAEDRAEKVLEQAKDGAIILMHDAQGNVQTVEALETIIPELKEQGYEFVTVSELFHAKEVEPQGYIVYSYAEQTTTY